MAVLIANCKKCAVVERVGDASHPVNTGELVQQVEKQLVELDTLLAGVSTSTPMILRHIRRCA